MGVIEGASAADVSQILNTTGVDLVVTDMLGSKTGGWFVCLLKCTFPPFLQLLCIMLNKNITFTF